MEIGDNGENGEKTKYTVEVEQIRRTTVEIEAWSADEAEELAYALVKGEEYDGNENWGSMEYSADASPSGSECEEVDGGFPLDF